MHNCWRACAKPRNKNTKRSRISHTVCSVMLCVWQKKRRTWNSRYACPQPKVKELWLTGRGLVTVCLWTETHGSLLCSWAIIHVKVLMRLTFSPSPRAKDGRKADERWTNLDRCQTIKAGMASVAKGTQQRGQLRKRCPRNQKGPLEGDKVVLPPPPPTVSAVSVTHGSIVVQKY